MKARVGKARMALLGTLLMLQMLPQASAATVTDVSDLRLEYFYPAIVAFAIRCVFFFVSGLLTCVAFVDVLHP